VVRDGDPPGSEPDLALWRGVVRFAGEDVVVLVTPRPSVVAGADADASKFKDINDLHQQAPPWSASFWPQRRRRGAN
jgi:hypothetical protein